MNHDELREWLRENLVIDVKRQDAFGPENSVVVGLRLIGDVEPFSSETLHIPD